VLLCMLETVKGGLCSLQVLDALDVLEVIAVCRFSLLEVPEVMRCVLLCMLEAVDGGLCLLEVLEAVQVPEVMGCVLFCSLEAVEGVWAEIVWRPPHSKAPSVSLILQARPPAIPTFRSDDFATTSRP